ncbi:COQ9-domain-containing protein [Polychytrium aggregatum]|uniref:COQ9-domain-containing protein n=1 Tax=Polychytrium aggregatum TaxID=110093 RepID=UPI0022FF3B00|nr:COQ9-domain-containing protein [Polychytrium aggregatum]KAI9204613.1 COQ9-domain-containing protein [Polychytrium aggregatum]
MQAFRTAISLSHPWSHFKRTHFSTLSALRHEASAPDFNIHLHAESQQSQQQRHYNPTQKILVSALNFVPTHGWTADAIMEGSKALGYSNVAHGLFPRGPIELVEFFIKDSTVRMRDEMNQLDLNAMKTTAKIRTACITRMKLTAPYIRKWPEAVALLALPQNAANNVANLGELVDEMWYIAGDRSVDMNWYTKRALLAAVYTSTELFMTQDRSPEFAETWKFLDRRLQDTAFVGRSASEIKNIADFGAKTICGILSSRGIRF